MNVPITCITFHLIKKDSIIFADKEGYIGNFEGVLSADKSAAKDSGNEDPLMEVSNTKGANSVYYKLLISCITSRVVV